MTLLYTAREARAKLGIKPTKFYQLLSDGQLDGRKLGTRLMITGESLRAFVDSLPRADIHMAARKTADSGDRKWDGTAAGRQASEKKAVACSAMAHLPGDCVLHA
jgi:hypothetical protein